MLNFLRKYTAGSCPQGVMKDVSCLCGRIKVLECLEYQRIPEFLCKEANVLPESEWQVAWELRILFYWPVSEDFGAVAFTAGWFYELCSGTLWSTSCVNGVRCVKVKREFSFLFVGKWWTASVQRSTVQTVPRRLSWDHLWRSLQTTAACLSHSWALPSL